MPSGTASLSRLCQILLKRSLPKSGTPRLSAWNSKTLTDEQVKYAAIDALVSLKVYLGLMQYPDLTQRLTPATVRDGMLVDIVPTSGNVVVMGTRMAYGVVDSLHPGSALLPDGSKVVRARAGQVAVRVDGVLAPHYILPAPYRTRSGTVTLSSFGSPPFLVFVSTTQLSPSIAGAHARAAFPGDSRSRSADPAISTDSTAGPAPADHPPAAAPAAAPASTDVDGFAPAPADTGRGVQATEVHDAAEGTCEEAHVEGDRAFLPDQLESQDDVYVSPDMQVDGDEVGADDGDDDDEDELVDLVDESNAQMTTEQGQACMATSDALQRLLDGEANVRRPPQLQEPAEVKDIIQTTLGDTFHYMDRVKVPKRHTYKKAFFAALTTAWLVPHPTIKREVEHVRHASPTCMAQLALTDARLPTSSCPVSQVLRQNGIDEEQLKLLWLFQRKFFKQRVPHHVPKPSTLYSRVYKVLAFFGPLHSPGESPLFNEFAWKAANNLLKEIARGHASDIPGKVYHRYTIGANGDPKVDKYGLYLIETIRGTNHGAPSTAHAVLVLYRIQHVTSYCFRLNNMRR